MPKEISRRKFLQQGAVAALSLAVVPNTVLGKKFGHVAPSDKLNVLGVGVGGRGAGVLKAIPNENIIGLCDVDWKYADRVFKAYPNAKKYSDYRRMYDELLKSADAVVVATADHTHAIVAADAMTVGKHVYVEKPLTHTVYESRLLTKLAKKHRVATQMGNQGASGEGVRKICEWIWNGEIGEVRKVEAFTDRPIWPQGLNRPEKVEKVPGTMNWDAFIGPAPFRPYNSIYTPWNFRGWWDFGTGALGDMACHILHPVFKGLKLGYPTKAQGSSTLLLTDCAPNAQTVKLIFPARDNMPKVAMPEVEVYWYDGGLMPMRPEGLPAGKNMNDSGGGVIFHGTKDTLICGCYGVRPYLLSGREPKAPEVLREVTTSHEMDWVRACKEDADSRVETTSYFGEAGPFNEMVVMGVLAVRLQGLNQELEWDGPNMRFTNIPQDATIKTVIKDGFKITDGHPTFDKTWTDPINANQFAEELIKHTYREGWALPDMPK
ncbi:MAG: Gfo/Idh/MocA family oxidoreductase [Bacteroidales bacterium]|nr:Gfo/Idh/MocA family oxidoreductase [Bacteroidales bacterium]MCL2133082.1 Gfo/Idh/MocA family oxidoreductase [Bacteroidales bacterium]